MSWRKRKDERHDQPPVIAGRVPPNDLNYEACVLSECMLDGSTIDEVADILEPWHFYADSHRIIFEAILWCAANGKPADINTVANRLRDNEKIARIGGPAYLAEVVNNTVAVADVREHAEAVRRLAIVRRTIATQQRLIAEGYSVGSAESATTYLDDVEAGIAEATSQGASATRDRSLKDIIADVFTKLEAGQSDGIPVNLRAFDHYTRGFFRGDLYIIAGRPGMGKTAFALELAKRISAGYVYDKAGIIVELVNERGERKRRVVALFELEMPDEQLGKRMIGAESGVNGLRLRDQSLLQPPDWQELIRAATELGPLPIRVDDTPAVTLAYIRSKARRIKAQAEKDGHEFGAIVIDYLQLMRGSGNGSQEEQLAEISRGLKQTAKELSVPVIALAQLNRSVETRGGDKRPMLSDLRGSGSMEQDADAVIFLYSEHYYNKDAETQYGPGETEIIIAKQRNGPTMTAPVRFVKSCGRFEDFEEWPRNNVYRG